MTQKQPESAWKKLMTNAMSKSAIPVANVLMFGDESSGKRSLLNALLASQNQRNEITLKYENAQTSERKKKYEHLYIFDYRYLRVNRFAEDDSSELGKINFYSLNKKFSVA